MVIGGGGRSEACLRRFVALAGGPKAKIVSIPTANQDSDLDDGSAQELKRLGAGSVTTLHTRDPKVADSAGFVAPLLSATGVWLGGGRQWRLADAYLNTRTLTEIRAVLDRGGAVGGSSAGATIQGSLLVRGDTRGNTKMLGDHTVGFGLLRNVAIDQHLLRRNRQFDLIPVIEAHPDVLGIGIDEDTAIVVEGDRFEVMGAGYVAIYDARQWKAQPGKFFFLAPGDRYDLRSRVPLR